ncbi:MAG: hypothetical protein PHU85_11450, partial [Phycisphaerae bacterium]|nr:hypothetical protein [Phycisphaerae bacterium]
PARSHSEQIAHEQHAAEVEINELADQASRANDALFDLMRSASQLSNQLHQYKTTQENLGNQRNRLATRAGEIGAQLSQRQEEGSQFRQSLAQIEARLADVQKRFEQTKAAAAVKDATIRELAGRLSSLKERRSALVGRRDLLASLEQKLEGLADGPRAILQSQGAIDGVVGLVADLLMVEPTEDTRRLAEVTAVVEAALGEQEQFVVLRNSAALGAESARNLLAALPGQTHLLCLDRLADLAKFPLDVTAWLSQPGVIGRVSDLVICEPVFLPVRDFLLGHVLRVETLADALRLAAEASPGSRVRFLTRDGTLVSADGHLSAPTGKDAEAGAQSPAALGLIGRKAELREVNSQLEGLAGLVAELESQLAAESAEAAQLDRSQQQLRGEIYQESTGRVECVARLRQIEQSIDSLASEQSLLASEMTDLANRIEQAANAERSTADKIASLEQRRQSMQQQTDDLNRRLQARRASTDDLNRRMTEAKVALGQAEERRRAVRAQLAGVRRSLEEAKAQQATATSDVRSLRQRIDQSLLGQLSAEQSIADLFGSRQGLTETRAALARQLEEVRKSLSELSAAAQAAGHELHAAEQTQHHAEVAQNELRVRLETLIQRVADEHAIDLPRLYEANPPNAESSTVNWQAVEAEITDLRGRIERLGNVNVEAIDEQQQLEKRSEFLHQQLADVIAAKGQLEALIERINSESRRRFETTFFEVREQFRELFRKLFGGGKADLVLENPDDILESGIDIIARPPGKELRSITLLSGGEKTMTALALLLSIFRSKPSPFCILDEVDAALDEANNDRFDAIVREFMQFSQFIVITHSKQTMTIADVLYGITMQEQGVSKRVAVRFDGRTVQGESGENLDTASTAVA